MPPNVPAGEIPWQKCREMHRPTSALGCSESPHPAILENRAIRESGSGTRRTAADTTPPRIGSASVSPPTQAKQTAPGAPTTSQAALTRMMRVAEFPRFWDGCGAPRDNSQLLWREPCFACCKRPPDTCGDRADEWSYETSQLIFMSPRTGNLTPNVPALLLREFRVARWRCGRGVTKLNESRPGELGFL